MKAKEVHDMTNDELNAKLSSLKANCFIFVLTMRRAIRQHQSA